MKKKARQEVGRGRPSSRQLQDLLGRLVAARAPAGREEEVRALIAETLPRGLTLSGTPLGSLHVDLGANGPRRLLLAAAMDQPSLIVSAVDGKGRARLKSLGPVEPLGLPGQRLRFESGGLGVVCTPWEAASRGGLQLESMWVEFGVDDREACPESLGAIGLFESALESIGGNWVGRSVASRVLLAILAGFPARLPRPTIAMTIAFLAHTSVEDRGLGPSANSVSPQEAILLRPISVESESAEARLALGRGPVLGIPAGADSGSRRLGAWLTTAARRSGVALQERVLPAEDPALNILQGSGQGVAATTLEIPAAHLNSPAEMIRREDAEALQALLLEAIRRPIKG
jgi:putative aminopeptidase FrvX